LNYLESETIMQKSNNIIREHFGCFVAHRLIEGEF